MRLAHSKAISVFPVPVLKMTEPTHLLSNHASTASSWSSFSSKGNRRLEIAANIINGNHIQLKAFGSRRQTKIGQTAIVSI